MRAFPLAFASLCLAAATAACAAEPAGNRSAAGAAEPPAGEVMLGGCRQGECGWLRIVRTESAGTYPEGELRRIVVRRGSSIHLDGELPESEADAEIEWDQADRAEYAFCSTRRPAYAFPGDETGLIVHFLDLFDLGGYQMGSARLYMHFCHESDGLPEAELLQSLGYRPGTRSEQIEGDSPDLMTRF